MTIETMRRTLVEFTGHGADLPVGRVRHAYAVYQQTFSLRKVLAAMS